MGTINKQAEAALLFSQRSPVYEKLEDIGDEMIRIGRDRAAEYLRDYAGNTDEVLEAIDYEIIQAGFLFELRVGIRNDGRIARSLMDKEEREGIFLLAAYEEVLG